MKTFPMAAVDSNKLQRLREREEKRFVDEHPRSEELYRRAAKGELVRCNLSHTFRTQ
jgi:hypothetical protein